MFVEKVNPMNLVWAFATFGISFVIGFIAVLIIYKDPQDVSEEVLKENGLEHLTSPTSGEIVSLSSINDEVFASGMMGDGLAIVPKEGELVAPEEGEVTMVFDTKHALGLKMNNGAEILFHIGLNTVQLAGEGFETFVNVGDRVIKGQKLIAFDLDKIVAAGYDPTVICVVTNKESYQVKSIHQSESVTTDTEVLSIVPIV